MALVLCFAACYFSCQKSCCWPCSFTFRQCRKCCAPQPKTIQYSSDDEEIDLAWIGCYSEPDSLPSPVLSGRGQLGKVPILNATPLKKCCPHPLPDQPRCNRYTARTIFQESPPSQRSMILGRHTYVSAPGTPFGTGLSNLRSTTSTVTRRGGGHHSCRENTSAALGPIGTFQDANGHLYNVVSANRMPNSRSCLSIPIDLNNKQPLDEETPHVELPTSNPSPFESLLSINLPHEKELNPRK